MVYVVTITEGYVPHSSVYRAKTDALDYAKAYAAEWDNEVISETGELYFNQDEDGNMEASITVEELDIIENAEEK